MKKYEYKAYGKINLCLDVIEKLDSGYHNVNMIMQMVDIYDVLTFSINEKNKAISIYSDNKDFPLGKDNLIYKALDMLIKEFNIDKGIDVSVQKNLPMAAGMAGGSSDCAVALIAANDIFNLGLNKEELKIRGVKLGADVPYCIEKGTCQSQGIGEILTKLPGKLDCFVVIAKPDILVSTKYVYEHLDIENIIEHPNIEAMKNAIIQNDIFKVADNMENVLENVTIKKYPIIDDIKDKMKKGGALNALMSGSGPSVFAIFDDEKLAYNCYEELKKEYNTVFITKLYN